MSNSNELKKCEEAFKGEIALWESKYLALQKEVQKMKKGDDAKVKNPEAERIEKILQECEEASKGLKAMGNKWTSCLEELSQRVLDIEQYSKKIVHCYMASEIFLIYMG